MTWHGPVLTLEKPSGSDNVENTPIKSVVVSVYKLQHGLYNHRRLLYLENVISKWPSLRYVEVKRDVTWACEEDFLWLHSRLMNHVDLAKCITLEERRVV